MKNLESLFWINTKKLRCLSKFYSSFVDLQKWAGYLLSTSFLMSITVCPALGPVRNTKRERVLFMVCFVSNPGFVNMKREVEGADMVGSLPTGFQILKIVLDSVWDKGSG